MYRTNFKMLSPKGSHDTSSILKADHLLVLDQSFLSIAKIGPEGEFRNIGAGDGDISGRGRKKYKLKVAQVERLVQKFV